MLSRFGSDIGAAAAPLEPTLLCWMWICMAEVSVSDRVCRPILL